MFSVDIMDINIEQLEEITIIELSGELDSISAPDVQREIMPLLRTESQILLDMSAVSYMSSAGLRVLLLLYRAIDAAVGDIIITGLRPAVQDVMEITGFLEFFRTATSREEGLQALG